MNGPEGGDERDDLGRTALLWAVWTKGPEETRRQLDRGGRRGK
jgi:hypothetical protein